MVKTSEYIAYIHVYFLYKAVYLISLHRQDCNPDNKIGLRHNDDEAYSILIKILK